jgi:Polymer-forming cytoskeletal
MPPNPLDTTGQALIGRTAEPLEVGMGRPLPPAGSMTVPLLRPQTQGLTPARTRGLPPPNCTTLAEGLVFTGNARLAGACSIGGTFEGNLSQAPGAQVSVVITETGRVKGDIAAQKISVMGHTEGLLDAGTGEVSLHDNAHVQGKVRYGRIVVNGADLNATLERVSPNGSKV